MLHTVKRILDIKPYKLTLEFNTGEVKLVDLEDRLKAKSTTTSSKFKELLDKNYFQTVKLQPEWETIFWDNGIDFCPDVLYSLGK